MILEFDWRNLEGAHFGHSILRRPLPPRHPHVRVGNVRLGRQQSVLAIDHANRPRPRLPPPRARGGGGRWCPARLFTPSTVSNRRPIQLFRAADELMSCERGNIIGRHNFGWCPSATQREWILERCVCDIFGCCCFLSRTSPALGYSSE